MRKSRFTLSLGCVAIWLLTVVAASAQVVKIDLPRGMNNAVADSALTGDSAVIVSVLARDQYYVGGIMIPTDQLGGRIGALLKERDETDRIVYVAGNASVDYGSIVEVFDIVRQQEVGKVGLIVSRDASEAARGVFLLELPLSQKASADLVKLKPNPLTLVASITDDLALRLNHETGPALDGSCFSTAPDGFGTDPVRLEQTLTCLFQLRLKARAYRIGMETRNDVPEAERIEKTVFVKASGSVKYGDVVRLINAVKGAGANPMGLQLGDDLPR